MVSLPPGYARARSDSIAYAGRRGVGAAAGVAAGAAAVAGVALGRGVAAVCPPLHAAPASATAMRPVRQVRHLIERRLYRTIRRLAAGGCLTCRVVWTGLTACAEGC